MLVKLFLIVATVTIIFLELSVCLQCGKHLCGYGTKQDECNERQCICKEYFGRKHSVTIQGESIQACIGKCWGIWCCDGFECGFTKNRTCKSGYLRDMDGACIHENSCDVVDSLCRGNSTCTSTLVLSYFCRCDNGYHDYTDGEIKNCTDIDECKLGGEKCGENASCFNEPGSYKCVCNSGFQPSEDGCLDMDECNQDVDVCRNAECTNHPGNFSCKCLPGYESNLLNNTNCTDVNECAQNSDLCGQNSTCINKPRYFQCMCLDGYESPHSNGTDCFDVDECTTDSTVCGENSICLNQAGNYTCSCRDGFKAASEGNFTCIRALASEQDAPTQPNSSLGLYVGIPIALIIGVSVVIVAIIIRRRRLSGRNKSTAHATGSSSRNGTANGAYENVVPSVILDHGVRAASTNHVEATKTEVSDGAQIHSRSRGSLEYALGYSNHKIAENKEQIRKTEQSNNPGDSQEPDIVYSAPYESHIDTPETSIIKNDNFTQDTNARPLESDAYNVLYQQHPKGLNSSDAVEYANAQTEENSVYSLATELDEGGVIVDHYHHLERK